VNVRKQELRNQVGKDYLLLKSLLISPLDSGDKSKVTKVMKDFFDIQEGSGIPYTGLILLDKDKKVVNAYSIKVETDVTGIIGSSYTGIEFKGSEKSLHKVLTVYRVDGEHPMGQKGVEIAFELKRNNEFLGWLVFQMDVNSLAEGYGVDEEDLSRFHFGKP
jgi:hypothetical protein